MSPVQLRVLIPYRIGDGTGCSEGCVVYINFDVFVVRDGVVTHYRDSRVPIGKLGVSGGTEITWRTESSREDLSG
jgi:hypothetical protein